MSILSLVALKPVAVLTLRSVHRFAIRFGRCCGSLLADAALERGRAVTCAYLMAMGIDADYLSAGDGRRRERDY